MDAYGCSVRIHCKNAMWCECKNFNHTTLRLPHMIMRIVHHVSFFFTIFINDSLDTIFPWPINHLGCEANKGLIMLVSGIRAPFLTLVVMVKGLIREEVVCFMLQGRIP